MNDLSSTSISPAASASQQTGTDLISNGSTASFPDDVLSPSQNLPVLVDFWAPWCGPCQQLGPALEKIVTQAEGRIKLVKINIDENPELASKMGVRSIPAVFSFFGGQPVDGFMGALPESEIKGFIRKQIQLAANSKTSQNDPDSLQKDMNAQIDQALITAQKALEDNDIQQALHIYGLILEQLPHDVRALSGLTKAFVLSGALDQAKQTLDLVQENDMKEQSYIAANTALKLAMEAMEKKEMGLSETGDIKARIESNPNDHQARMDMAIMYNASGNRQKATQALIEIIRRDRSWNNDGARTKLLEFFEAWGQGSPESIAGRKLLSRTLFS